MKKNLMIVCCFGFVLSSFATGEKKENELNSVTGMVIENPIEDGKQESREEEKPDPITIFISVVPDYMKFDTDTFTVVAGQEVIIELENTDGMQHNMLIAKPGTLEKVGAAADALARDPKGAQKEYVPEVPEVLYATKMLNPGDFATLEFTAPSEPGDYPFVCTFPGHWRMMNGIMKVVAEK